MGIEGEMRVKGENWEFVIGREKSKKLKIVFNFKIWSEESQMTHF